MFVRTPEDNLTQVPLPVRLTLAKNRHGAPGEARAVFNGPHLRFTLDGDDQRLPEVAVRSRAVGI